MGSPALNTTGIREARSSLPHRFGSNSTNEYNDGDAAPDRLGYKRRYTVILTVGEAVFDRKIAPFLITEFLETALECGEH